MSTENQHISSYTGGMDKETSVSKYDKNKYYHAEELRLVTHSGLNSGSLNSVKGNALHFSLNSATEVYLGHCFIRDKIVIFSKYIALDEDRIYYSDFVDGDFTVIPDDLKFSGNLGFNSNYPIKKAIGRYETEGVEKVYWTDGLNNVRHANLADNIFGYTADKFDFLPNINFEPISIESIGSGSLKVGKVQYAYQYYNLRGSESVYSPASGTIDLAPKNLTLSDTRQYFGGDIGDSSGKSVTLSIDAGSNINKFDRVRLIRIHHEDINILPVIDIVSEREITASMTFTDTGNTTLETIPTEFFQELKNLFVCNDLEVKNNYLFAAGINEKYFDFDYDARAYRFSDTSEGLDINTFATVNNDIVLFNKPIIFRTTAEAGLTGASPFDDFWYYEGGIIYFLAPIVFNETVNGTAYSTSEIIDSEALLADIFTFDAGVLTFGTRDIHSTEGITQVEEELEQPGGWNPGTASGVHASLSGNTTVTIDDAAINNDSDHWGVPDTHDSINPYNALSYTGTEYMYKRDGTTIGGEGPNISYEFDTKQILIDNSEKDTHFYTGTETVEDNTSYTNYASPFMSLLYTGYQRDEIYSFGIVGYDVKGRQSFVQWIGDIRFPKITDDGFSFRIIDYDSLNGKVYANILYIKFNVTNLPSDVVSYQIVRCERTLNDRTVLDSGLVGSIGRTNIPERRFNLFLSNERITDDVGGTPVCNRLFEYISPEVNFNKDSVPLLTDYLDIVQQSHPVTSTIFSNQPAEEHTTYSCRTHKIRSYFALSMSTTRYTLDDIKLFNTSMDTMASITVDGETIPNQVYDPYTVNPADDEDCNYKGTTIVLRTHEEIPITNRANYKIFLAYRRRDITPYGGNTYSSRSNRTYIPCSDIIQKSYNQAVDCFQGDTFIDYFDYLRVIWNGERPATHSSTFAVYFPVETSVNLSLRLDKSMNKLLPENITGTPTIEKHFRFAALKETAGAHLLREHSAWDNPYLIQARDLYQYNPVYSKPNNVRQFSAKPFDFDILSQNSFDCRVTNTDKKLNGEMSDSWTVFRFNNIVEVDTKRGPITAIENVGDSLLYFQPEGLGVLSIEERELTQSSTAGQLSLGTGGVLARYDYLSTSDGCSDKFSILETKTGLYFFDRKNNCVSKLGENIEEITKILGLQPYFNQNVDGSGVIRSAYNRKYNELLFTYDGDNEFTLALDELSSTFTNFYAFIPKAYITKGQHLFSTLNGRAFFKHDEGDTSTYYGTTYPSKLTLIINPGGHQMCRFDVMRFITDVRAANGDYISKTFSNLRAKTSYQDTGDINLDDEAVERMKVWRYNKFRDDEDDEPSLKDTYMIVELTFANTSNEVIRIDDIVTMFTPIRIH